MADQAHFTDENIQKLRKLIQFVAPEEFADWGDARIIFGGGRAAKVFSVSHHGSKLVNAKRYSTQADANAAIENWTGRPNFDDQRDNEQDWGE